MIRRNDCLERDIVIKKAGLVALARPLKVNRYDAIDAYDIENRLFSTRERKQ